MKTAKEDSNIPVVFFIPVSFQALENSKAWASQEHDKLVNKLKMTIQEKDKTIGVSKISIKPPSLLSLLLCLLYFVIFTTMLPNYSNSFFCYFSTKGLVESGREKDKMLKALQVSSLIKISSWACSRLALAFKLNLFKMTPPSVQPEYYLVACRNNTELSTYDCVFLSKV